MAHLLYNFCIFLFSLNLTRTNTKNETVHIKREKIIFDKLTIHERVRAGIIPDFFEIPIPEIDNCKTFQVESADGEGNTVYSLFVRASSPFWAITFPNKFIPKQANNSEIPALIDVLKCFAKKKLEIINDGCVSVDDAKYSYNQQLFKLSFLWFCLAVLFPLFTIIAFTIFREIFGVLSSNLIDYYGGLAILFFIYALVAIRGVILFKWCSQASLVIENNQLYFLGRKSGKLINYIFPTLKFPTIKYDLNDLIHVGHEFQKLNALAIFDAPSQLSLIHI